MQDLLYGEDIDRRLNWSLGRAERLARKQKLPHYMLPDGSIRFVWNDWFGESMSQTKARRPMRRESHSIPTALTRPIETAPTSSPESALLVGRLEAARLCAVSPASWDRLTAAGKTPRPIKLGGRVVWRRSDLDAWTEHNCPDRQTFDALTER